MTIANISGELRCDGNFIFYKHKEIATDFWRSVKSMRKRENESMNGTVFEKIKTETRK